LCVGNNKTNFLILRLIGLTAIKGEAQQGLSEQALLSLHFKRKKTTMQKTLSSFSYLLPVTPKAALPEQQVQGKQM